MKLRFIILLSCLPSLLLMAGPGHDHGEGAFAQGGVQPDHFDLTQEQFDNLGIKLEKVKRLPMQDTVEMLAFTELLPEKSSIISPRSEGEVIDVKVKVGQNFKKGDVLAVLQPLSIGSNKIEIKAPMNGFVLNLYEGIGSVVQAGGWIMEIGDSTQMLVRGVAYETPDVFKLEVGQDAEVHLDIMPDRHIHGKVQKLNRVIDPRTRTFSVYVVIETPESDVPSGLQGTLEIFTGDNEPVLSVPKSAVLGGLDEYIVYVMNGLHVDRKKVTIGAKSAHHIEIKSGLNQGDLVVTRGNYQLQYVSMGGAHDHGHDDEPSELSAADELAALDALLEHEEVHDHDSHHEEAKTDKPKEVDEHAGHNH